MELRIHLPGPQSVVLIIARDAANVGASRRVGQSAVLELIGISRFFCVLWIVSLVIVAVPSSLRASDKVVLLLPEDHQFQFAGYYAALWFGHFKGADIEVEIRSAVKAGGERLDVAREVAEGRADFGVGDANILLANTPEHPLVVSAVIFQQSATALFARQESKVNSPGRLTRVRIARQAGDDAGWAQMRAIMRAEGVDPEAVKPLLWDPRDGALLDQLVARRFDAYVGYRMLDPWLAQKSGIRISVLRPSAYGVDFYGDSLFTRAAWAEKDPDLVARFTAAAIEGWRYALENGEEMAERISTGIERAAPVSDPLDLNRFMIAEVRDLMLGNVIELGHINPSRWRRMHQVLAANGLEVPALDLDRFVFDPVQREVKRHRLVSTVMVGVFLAFFAAAFAYVVWSHLRHRIEMRGIAALRESEERMRQVVENMPVLMAALDGEGNIIAWNRECERVTGYPAKEIVGNPKAMELLLPDPTYRENLMAEWKRRGHDYRNWEWRITAMDGTHRMVEWSNISKRFPIPGWFAWGIGVDATERNRAEDALRKSEEKYRQIAESSSDWFWEMGPDLRFTSVTDRFFEVAGVKPDDVLGRRRSDMAVGHQDLQEREKWRAHLAVVERHEPFRNFEYTVRSHTGQLLHISISGTPVFDGEGRFQGYRGTGTDVTRQREAERTIRDLAKFPEQNPGPVMRSTRDGMLLYANLASAPILAHWRTEVGDGLPEDWCGIVRAALEAGIPRELEVEAGRQVFSLMVSPVVTSGYVNLYGRDITPRRRALEALRESEERFRSIMEHAADAIIIHDINGAIVDVNQSACDMLGYERDEILGLTVSDLEKDYDPATMRELWQWVLDAGPATLEGVGLRKDGRTLPIEMRIGRLRLGERDLLLVLARDIHERKEAEDSLKDSKARAEAANRAKSEFLAGLSHELRLPLKVMTDFAIALVNQTLGPLGRPEYLGYARSIDEAGRELLELVEDMADMTQVETNAFVLREHQVEIAPVVAACERLLGERIVRGGLTLSVEMPKDLPPLRADERRLRQILLNLLVNAVTYTPEGGTVSVSAVREGDGAMAVVVAETGIGISPEDLGPALSGADRVAPLSSRGRNGSGLGLALARRLMELHGGTLDLSSRLDHGTTVTVRFPASRVMA